MVHFSIGVQGDKFLEKKDLGVCDSDKMALLFLCRTFVRKSNSGQKWDKGRITNQSQGRPCNLLTKTISIQRKLFSFMARKRWTQRFLMINLRGKKIWAPQPGLYSLPWHRKEEKKEDGRKNIYT